MCNFNPIKDQKVGKERKKDEVGVQLFVEGRGCNCRATEPTFQTKRDTLPLA